MKMITKNAKLVDINTKILSSVLSKSCTSFKDDLIEFKCLCYKEKYPKKFDEILNERFANTYKYFNHNINKFNLLLQIEELIECKLRRKGLTRF